RIPAGCRYLPWLAAIGATRGSPGEILNHSPSYHVRQYLSSHRPDRAPAGRSETGQEVEGPLPAIVDCEGANIVDLHDHVAEQVDPRPGPGAGHDAAFDGICLDASS